MVSGRTNGVSGVRVIQTDLVDSLNKTLQRQFDLLVTNPTFEPSPMEDIGKPGSICAWSAGPKDRLIIDRTLVEMPKLMSGRGLALMCCCEKNDVDGITMQMLKQTFYSTIVTKKDNAPTLKILCLRVIRKLYDEKEAQVCFLSVARRRYACSSS